jgi:hypothetical protein
MGERLHAWGTRQIDVYIDELAQLRADLLDDRLVADAGSPVRLGEEVR